ncbi:hypothetical protein D3C72_2278430 [compost metagenome]
MSVASCWRSSPFTRVLTVSGAAGSNSSAVTSHGPIEPLASKFLPCVTLNLPWRSQSRTVPSFRQVSPAIWLQASSAAMRRPGLPITMAISPS